MTVFRSGERAPAWCELDRFEIITLSRAEIARRMADAKKERLIGTSGTCQLRCHSRSLLLKEAQFIDLPRGEWTMNGASDMAQFVRLSGHWGEEMAGCGIFQVKATDLPDLGQLGRGDPVGYSKNTAVDRHYHDCDEYWIVLEGHGEAVVDDRHNHVGPGDCLCIGMGHPHDFPLVETNVKAVFFETTLQGQKRTGHLWNHTHGIAQPQPGRV